MKQSFINLVQEFNTRTGTPRQVSINFTDNSNSFISCFQRASARIQTDHNWKSSLVTDASVIGDGIARRFALPEDFIKLAVANLYDHSLQIKLYAGSAEEFLDNQMLNLKGESLLKYMIVDGFMVFSDAPANGAKISFAYWSDGLVNNWDAKTEKFVAGSRFKSIKDTFKIDDELLILGAQMFYAKQLEMQDKNAAEEDYQKRLSWVIRRYNEPFVKDLAGDRPAGLKLLGAAEINSQPYGWKL
jgi:hypothetical protein